MHRTDAPAGAGRHLREQIGDEQFIAGLPGGGRGRRVGRRRGVLDARAARRRRSPRTHDDELRRKLVNDLLTTWHTGFFRNAREDAEGFVSLDRGLTEISRHAKELGYDALILFLDELILWLANSIGDQQFVSREIQKITNFVEGADARRPIPIISFIARQRDLRELVGEEVTGANELGFQDTLNLASGRFDVITLEDRNLPEIASRGCSSRSATRPPTAIARAFDATTKVRREVWDTLLGTDSGAGADLDAFRTTYPFSPAFMSTLVHVSSALQRSRTALKLMRQLLVDRRDEPAPRAARAARRPLRRDRPRRRPAVHREAEGRVRDRAEALRRRSSARTCSTATDLTDDELERARRGGHAPHPSWPAACGPSRGDDRLIKTLLLSALAPSVPALRNLTARRTLGAQPRQHHQPDPRRRGRARSAARSWTGPASSARSRSARATTRGSPGTGRRGRRQRPRTPPGTSTPPARARRWSSGCSWEELGVAAERRSTSTEARPGLAGQQAQRRGDLRQRPRPARHPRRRLRARSTPTRWRLIIDYPFDDGTHGPADDRQRVQKLRGTDAAPGPSAGSPPR